MERSQTPGAFGYRDEFRPLSCCARYSRVGAARDRPLSLAQTSAGFERQLVKDQAEGDDSTVEDAPYAAPATAPGIYYTTMDSPCGPICLAGTATGLIWVDFQVATGQYAALRWQAAPDLLSMRSTSSRNICGPASVLYPCPQARRFNSASGKHSNTYRLSTTLTCYRELHSAQMRAARAVGHANGRNQVI